MATPTPQPLVYLDCYPHDRLYRLYGEVVEALAAQPKHPQPRLWVKPLLLVAANSPDPEALQPHVMVGMAHLLWPEAWFQHATDGDLLPWFGPLTVAMELAQAGLGIDEPVSDLFREFVQGAIACYREEPRLGF